MVSTNDRIISLDTWRKIKSGRVQGFERPTLSASLLDVLLALSQHKHENYHYAWSQTVFTCDALAWLSSDSGISLPPIEFIDFGCAFGRPQVTVPDLDAIEDEPDFSMWNFFATAVSQCATIEAAVSSIDESEQLVESRHVAPNERNQSNNNSKPIRSAIIDFSLPFGGVGGSFDKMLSFMPGQFTRIRSLKSHVALMASLLFLDHCKNLEELIVYLPTGSLFQASLAPCRRFLRERMGLAALIEMPSGVLHPAVGIPCSIALFQKKPTRTQTLFYTLFGTGDLIAVQTQPWFGDLMLALSGGTPRYGFLATVDADGAWTSKDYLPKTNGLPNGLMEFSGLKRLADLFDIYSGIRFSRQLADGLEGHPVIRGRDIAKNATKESLERFSLKGDIPDRVRARSGDILLQKIGARPTLSLVQDDLAGAIAGDTVLILRPRDTTVPSDSIVQLLSSPIGKAYLANVVRGAGTPTVSIEQLKSLQIPILPIEVQHQILAAQTAEEQVRQIASRLSAIRESIFVADSKDEFVRKLLALQTETSIISSSLVASRDFNHSIRNFYPFPLAYPYRMLDSHFDQAILYKEQLRFGENLLAFVASTTLALLGESECRNGQLNLASAFRGGISPGTWRELATKGAPLLAESRAGRLCTALRSLWKHGNRETKFYANVRQLVEIKNKFKHDKEVLLSEREYYDGCVRLAEILKSCMQDLEAFVQFPIILITDLDVDRRTGLSILDTLTCIGDHPALRQSKVNYSKSLPKNILFIEVEDGRYESLYPFITVQHCPTCRFREFFFVDRWDGEHTNLKSFERGHQEKSATIGNDLKSFC